MPTLRTRTGNSTLTHAELDANFKRTVTQKTTTYQVLISDNRSVIEGNHASTPFTVTLPPVATADNSETGDFEVTVTNINAAVVTVDGSGAETIDGSASLTLQQWASATFALDSAQTGWKTTAKSNVLTHTGALTVSGVTTATGGLVGDVTGTIQTAAQTNITSVGTLTSLDVSGDITGSTVKADGDTSAGDLAAMGYTATEGLILTGQGSTNDVTIKNDADADVITIPTGTTNVGIAGNLTVTGGQVAFPATQNASANANTLDDYEEGSWTPALWDASNSDAEGQTYTTQTGKYTKIGNVVHIAGHLQPLSLGTLTTSLGARIGNLPFTASAQVGPSITFGKAEGMTITAGRVPTGLIEENTNYIELNLWDAATGTSLLLISEVSAGANLRFSGTYFV